MSIILSLICIKVIRFWLARLLTTLFMPLGRVIKKKAPLTLLDINISLINYPTKYLEFAALICNFIYSY